MWGYHSWTNPGVEAVLWVSSDLDTPVPGDVEIQPLLPERCLAGFPTKFLMDWLEWLNVLKYMVHAMIQLHSARLSCETACILHSNSGCDWCLLGLNNLCWIPLCNAWPCWIWEICKCRWSWNWSVLWNHPSVGNVLDFMFAKLCSLPHNTPCTHDQCDELRQLLVMQILSSCSGLPHATSQTCSKLEKT